LAGFTEPLHLDRLDERLKEEELKMWDIIDNASKQIIGYAGLVYYLGAKFGFAVANDEVLDNLSSNLRQDILIQLAKAYFSFSREARFHFFARMPVSEEFSMELEGIGFDSGDDFGDRFSFSMKPETFALYYEGA
jgi:hypothetical protein